MSIDREEISDIVRATLAEKSSLTVDAKSISTDEDLFSAGMNSFASVNVMMSLEDRFDVEFPDALLTRENFESVGAIVSAVESLLAAAQ